MVTSSASGDKPMDIDETSAVPRPGLSPREGQLLQGITSLQMQLNVVSRRQDELMELIGVLREQEGVVPSLPNDVQDRALPLRGSASGPVPPAEDKGGPSISNPNCSPSSEHSLNIPKHPRQPPHHPDPVSRYPNPQRIPLSQGQGLGQPPLHPLDMNGRPLNPPLPPQRPVPHLGHSVPVFGQLQNPMGQVIGLIHRGSFTVPGYTGPGPSFRQLPPGCPHVPPQMYPQMQPRVHPQIPPQMNPQIPPQAYPQMQPQMQMRGPMPMNWDTLPGPPPPYPGPGSIPGESAPGVNQAGPSTTGHRTSMISGTHTTSQQQGQGLGLNRGQGDNGVGLDVPPVSRNEATGRVPTRVNPTRRARPTQLRESD